MVSPEFAPAALSFAFWMPVFPISLGFYTEGGAGAAFLCLLGFALAWILGYAILMGYVALSTYRRDVQRRTFSGLVDTRTMWQRGALPRSVATL